MNWRVTLAALSTIALFGSAFAAETTGTQPRTTGTAKTTTATAETKMETLASGTKYEDVVVGTGKEATKGSTVVVHYTGTLPDGKKFDSSRDRNEPFTVENLGSAPVIQGWNEGIVGMKEGGKRKLVIPPNAGYGPRGFPPVIPPSATLHFDVELLEVK